MFSFRVGRRRNRKEDHDFVDDKRVTTNLLFLLLLLPYLKLAVRDITRNECLSTRGRPPPLSSGWMQLLFLFLRRITLLHPICSQGVSSSFFVLLAPVPPQEPAKSETSFIKRPKCFFLVRALCFFAVNVCALGDWVSV